MITTSPRPVKKPVRLLGLTSSTLTGQGSTYSTLVILPCPVRILPWTVRVLLYSSHTWPVRVLPLPVRALPSSTLTGHLWARAQARSNHYFLVRPKRRDLMEPEQRHKQTNVVREKEQNQIPEFHKKPKISNKREASWSNGQSRVLMPRRPEFQTRHHQKLFCKILKVFY